MACALVLLAGCYEVASEFIGPGEAQFVPGLAGTFDDDDGGTTEITLLPGNEYHYRETEPDGSTSSGTFRAVWLHGDVYLLQARDDDGGLYAMYYWFTYQNDYASYGGMDVEDTVYSLATAYSVTIDPEFMYLEGDASQVRAFLFAHGPEHLFRY
ncbi:MAG: hypothetical protein HOH66_07125 [Rhodospirillaceae bacterium]|nr:hypothetical protein [Rhodospirillaceae bacterium]